MAVMPLQKEKTTPLGIRYREALAAYCESQLVQLSPANASLYASLHVHLNKCTIKSVSTCYAVSQSH